MDPFNAPSTTAAARKIPLLKEASPTKVISCVLIASTDLQKDLDVVKEVTGGDDTPSAKMAGRSAMVCGQSVHREEGGLSPAHQGFPCTRGHGMHPTCALSPRLTIGKEHRSVMPTRLTMGILTLRKVIVQRQLMVPLSSSDDELSLVKHDAQVDLNPDGTRIRYTQEPALMSESSPPSPPCYIVSGQWVGVGYGKVLIPNPDYKGKGHTESALSNPTPRVQ
jgi:hypothetical protein